MSEANLDKRLKLALEVALANDKVADKLLKLSERHRELAEMFAFLLERTALKLNEKGIHKMLDELEAEQKRKEKVNMGIPRKVFNRGRTH
jgi:hypothetical protein